MRLNVSPLPTAFRVIIVGALIYSILYLSVLAHDALYNLGDCFAAIRLTWSTLILSLIGFFTMRITGSLALISSGHTETANRSAEKQSADEASALPWLSKAIISIAVGQLVIMCWVYCRSALSGIAFYIVGLQLPISTLELIVILAVIIANEWTRMRSALLKSKTTDLLGYTLIIASVVLPLVIRDLPRSVGLSSDPDQHAFWASQVYKLGVVPWDQGLTGEGHFGYPGGFAVLNAIWMTLSGISAVEMVTIQPVLQFLLAIITCAAVCPLLCPRPGYYPNYRSQPRVISDTLLLSLVSLATYWALLPYGYQAERWHGEGTARLSASWISALVVLAWIIRAKDFQNSCVQRLMLATSAVCILATIHPLTAIIPAILLGLIAVDYLQSTIGLCGWTSALTTGGLIALLGLLILAGEPYLVTSLFSFWSAPSLASVGPSSSSNITSFGNLYSLVLGLSPSQLMPYLSAATFLRSGATASILATMCIIALWFYRSPGTTIRWLATLLICGAVGTSALSFQLTSSPWLPLYLVAPYIYESALQVGAILGFILIVAVIGPSISLPSSWRRRVFVVLAAIILCYQYSILTSTTSNFNLTPRECRTDAPYCLTQSDQKALTFIEELGARIRAQYPDISYRSAPKVLLLGTPKQQGVEHWVFPSGIARVIAIHSSIPVAFFYGRGSPDWSYENYLSRVCRKLDLQWLTNRNIRYLVLGKREPGCMKRRSEVVKRGNLIFEDGGVRILELNPSKPGPLNF
ncbi:MAG: hypothetical protein ACK5GN_06590 [Pseudomonadota bacterium]|jgi:hypothetical protein